jgi:hypothetical protein
MHRLQPISIRHRFLANAPSHDRIQAHELHEDVLTDKAPTSKFDKQAARRAAAGYPVYFVSLGSASLLMIISCQP